MDSPLVFTPNDRILTHSDLRIAGYSASEIRRARLSGELVPLVRGSYATGSGYRELSPELQHGQRARSRALGSPSVVLSHVSAAVIHGLPVPRDALDIVHVIRAGRGGSRVSAGVRQHAAVLGSGEIVSQGGVSVTSLARTLVDLSSTMSFENSVMAADVALREHPGAIGDLAESLVRARHRPGAGKARRALAFADGRSESPGESRTRVLLHQAGLPAAELQCEIFDGRGSFVARVDLALPECAVVIEFDGMVKYGDLMRGRLTPQQVLAKEKRREDGLRELGWYVVRLTWADLADLDQLAARVTGAIARGRRVIGSGGLAGSIRLTAPIRIGAL